MGVQVEFDPPPRFDRSLVSWLGKTVNSTRKGFLQVPGSEWKTGIYTAVFTAAQAVHVNVPFGYTFKKGIPLVVVSPVAGMGGHDFEQWVTKVDTVSFNLLIKTYQYNYIAVTQNVPVRWLAIIP